MSCPSHLLHLRSYKDKASSIERNVQDTERLQRSVFPFSWMLTLSIFLLSIITSNIDHLKDKILAPRSSIECSPDNCLDQTPL
jgi:hypothetical protein